MNPILFLLSAVSAVLMSYAFAAFLRPFVQAAFVILIGWPIRAYVMRHMKDGKLKRLLLLKIY